MSALRVTFRRLIGEPAFTTTVLLTLALCIAANVAIFAMVDAILLRPLPFPEADRLVRIFNTYPAAGIENDQVSFTNYYERRGQIAAFADLAIYRADRAIVGEAGSTQRADILRVSPEFFATLGVNPGLGRTFKEEETTFQTEGVAILADAYWRQHFQGDPAALGREIHVDGLRKTIVGVLPPGFRFLSSSAGIFLPLSSNPAARGPNQRYNGSVAEMIARLKPGISLTEGQAQVDAHHAAMEAASPYPQFKRMVEMGFRARVVSLHADHVQSVRPLLWLLQGAVLFLLLLGGINLVNLLLIRASGRAREFAIRQALGAGSRHIAREIVLETSLLALGGGALGLILGAFGVDLLGYLGATEFPLGATISLDGRVAFISLLGSLLVGLALAAPIVWFSLRGRLAGALQTESRGGTASRAAQRVRHSFIVTQIALAFVLLSGAALLGLSLHRVLATSPGFQAEHVLAGRLALPFSKYRDTNVALGFMERLLTSLQTQPGVSAVAIGTVTPFGERPVNSSVSVDVSTAVTDGPRRGHFLNGVVGDYWQTLGIRLLEGRLLTDPREPRVCVVDEDFARHYWPGESALGHQLNPGPSFNPADASTIVGVVSAVKQNDLTDTAARGTIYFPYTTLNALNFSVVVRSIAEPATLAATLRQAVRAVDPGLPLDEVQTMQQRIDDSLVARRSPAVLAGIFASVALLLAAIGTYGVLAYAVGQRRREIGVRMALGALPQQVLAHFLALGAKLLFVGLVAGSFGALATARTMQTLLFGVGAMHLGVLAATAGAMITIVFVAILLPSRRAAHINPIDALRAE